MNYLTTSACSINAPGIPRYLSPPEARTETFAYFTFPIWFFNVDQSRLAYYQAKELRFLSSPSRLGVPIPIPPLPLAYLTPNCLQASSSIST
jgi:hypothetical protein